MTAPWSQEAHRRQGIWEIGLISGENANKRDNKKWNLLRFSEIYAKGRQNQYDKTLLYFNGKFEENIYFLYCPKVKCVLILSLLCTFHWVSTFFMPSLLYISILFVFDQQAVLVQGLTLCHPQLGLDHDVCFVPQRGKTSKKGNNYILQRKSNFSLPTASSIEINRRLVAIQLY